MLAPIFSNLIHDLRSINQWIVNFQNCWFQIFFPRYYLKYQKKANIGISANIGMFPIWTIFTIRCMSFLVYPKRDLRTFRINSRLFIIFDALIGQTRSKIWRTGNPILWYFVVSTALSRTKAISTLLRYLLGLLCHFLSQNFYIIQIF